MAKKDSEKAKFQPWAIFKSGGHQYKVCAGERIRIGKIPGNVGDKVTLSEVILSSASEGELAESKAVKAVITAQGKGPKVVIYKKRRRKGYHNKTGHRQDYTEVEINSVN